jgi:hypothetical protein
MNYLARHWRGELSLGVSYWVNGLLAQSLGFALVLALATGLQRAKLKWAWAISWTVTWLVIGIVVVWQVVGVWRSARKHVAYTGRVFWARTAQAVMVMSILRLGVEFATAGIPAIRQGVELGRWLTEHGHWQIRLMKGETELEVSGGIGWGLAEDLERALHRAPRVRLVHLNLGMGGLIEEAKDAAAVIRVRTLATYTSTACVSACTLIFLGGEKRFIRTGARLGFHAPRSPGMSGFFKYQMLDREERYLISAGVTAAFARRVVQTKSEAIWFPTERELIDSGAVTEVTSGDDFAVSGFGDRPTRASLDVELQRERIFRALQSSDPDAYRKILDAELAAYERGDSMDQLRAVTVPLISRVVTELIQYSSDEAVLRLGKLTARQLDLLKQAPPEVCRGHLLGQPEATAAALRYFPPAIRREEVDVNADIIETADRKRVRVSQAALQTALHKALTKARASAGDDLNAFTALNDPSADPKAICRAASAFFAAVMSLSPDDAALLIRGLNAK